jgi:hypothetical protein
MRTVVTESRVSALLDTTSLIYPRIQEQYEALEWKLARKPEGGVPLKDHWIYRQGRVRSDMPELTVLYTYDIDTVNIISIRVVL